MPVLPLQRDLASAPFFDAAAQGRLLLRRCVPAAHWNAPSALTCVQCHALALDWTEAAGTGVVVTWAVIHPKGADPLRVCVAQLDEGPWLRGPVRDAAGVDLGGRRVRVAFERADGGEPVPVFALDGSTPGLGEPDHHRVQEAP